MKIPFNICLCLSPTGLPRVLWHSTLTSPKKVWRGSSHNWPRETLTRLSLADSYIPLTTHGPYITLLRQPTNITTIIRLTIPMGIANPSPGHANRFFLLKNNKKISGCTVDLDLLSADNSCTVWHYRYWRPFVNKYQSFLVVYASASVLALRILIVYWTLLSPKKVWRC